MEVGFLSLPIELICYVTSYCSLHLGTFLAVQQSAVFPLSVFPPMLTSCKTICDAARNSAHIQYKLELHAQGFTDITTLDSISVSRKMRSLEKLTSLWRSDFQAKTVSKKTTGGHIDGQWKCGIWWDWLGHIEDDDDDNLFIWDSNTNIELSQEWPGVPIHGFSKDVELKVVVFDPLQDLVVSLFSISGVTVTDFRQDCATFLVEFLSASSQLPHPHSVCTSLEFKHAFEPGHIFFGVFDQLAIYGDRVVFLYYIMRSCHTQDLFMQVIDWRKGLAKSVSPLILESSSAQHTQYPLRELEDSDAELHLVDERTIVVTDVGRGYLILYTLQEVDGSLRHRITYHLPYLGYLTFRTYSWCHPIVLRYRGSSRPFTWLCALS